MAAYDGEDYFLGADLFPDPQSGKLTINEDLADRSAALDFIEKVETNTRGTFDWHMAKETSEPMGADEYVQFVKECVHNIEKGLFQKVVPARCIRKQRVDGEKILGAFFELIDNYPNAFISLVSSPETGTWLGASPELLVSTEQGKTFTTVALAGTQTNKPDTPLRHISWTQKEIEEQALVSRYIINCFKKIRLREFDEYGPKTVVAGNLMHLKTIFTVDMVGTRFPDLGSVMLELLHPTSAVCGLPMAEAKAFLKEHEKLDRGYFSGFLGPVNFEGDTSLFVNLRCVQATENGLLFYAGAGVTIDSEPENELLETGLKFATLEKFFT